MGTPTQDSKANAEISKPLKLLIAISGIIVCYILLDYNLEYLFKSSTRPKFTFPFAIYNCQAIFAFLVAKIVNDFYYKKGKPNGRPDTRNFPIKTKLLMALSNALSVVCGPASLEHISLPLLVMMKSSKTISIIAYSALFGKKGTHSKSQYLCAVVITCGIISFNYFQNQQKGSDTETSLIGLALIGCALFCDGFLANVQTELKKVTKYDGWDLMEILSLYSGTLIFGYALVTGQFMNLIEYLKAYPDAFYLLLGIGLAGTAGQIFIFYTISNFSPLTLSIITSTRKFLSVVFSIFVFGHTINSIQTASVLVVFAGVYYELYSTAYEKNKSQDKAVEAQSTSVEGKTDEGKRETSSGRKNKPKRE